MLRKLRVPFHLVMASVFLCCSTALLSPMDVLVLKPSHTSQIFNEVQTAELRISEEGVLPQVLMSVSPPIPNYLKAIGIPEAWAKMDVDVLSTIAIVDTGVDYNNPQLKPYLLEGKNLVNERKTAQDDNGHGTAVAGVIVAVAKAGESSTGQGRWKGKLLPVKALDQFGSGNEEKLTQGIRYSVDQGADIVVLSLGLRRDAPGLREAVEYAEKNGVLLVAASGNDAALFGARAAVQYPAAYPTVLAVAGSEDKQPVSQSTSGSENDVSASWRIQTLAINGGTIVMEGTSMGAPQVAATAAMIKAVHPNWAPIRLRETLRRTAEQSGKAVWNPNMGYGLISAINAVQVDSDIDWREPNDDKVDASEFPLGKEIVSSWGSPKDVDWYTFEAPYDGTYRVRGDDVRISLYNSKTKVIQPQSVTVDNSNSKGLLKQWEVTKGRYWLQVQSSSLNVQANAQSPDEYRLESQFTMKPDAKEPNDSAASASTLPPRSQQWVGSFHQRGDKDWFVVTLPKPGILKLSVSTDTTRIDPELMIQQVGSNEILVDERGDGGNEQWILNNAKAGKYYFRISNAASSNPEAVIGTYAASLEYITEKEDFYEPNESPLTSTPLSPGKIYNGLINTTKDQDWYKFTLNKKQKVKLSINPIPGNTAIRVELRDKKLQTIKKWINEEGQSAISGEEMLQAGSYYVKVTGDRSNRNEYYGLKLYITNS